MGSLYRSQLMSYCQMLMPPEAAYDCVVELGDLEKVAFVDLKADASPFDRTFASEVKRCDGMEAQLKYLLVEMEKEKITPAPCDAQKLPTPDISATFDMETKFQKCEQEVHDSTVYLDVLAERYFDLLENQRILEKADQFLGEAQDHFKPPEPLKRREREDQRAAFNVTKIRFVSAVILRTHLPAFERMLWRVCQGNLLVREEPFGFDLFDPGEDLDEGYFVDQSAVMVFFQGEQLEYKVRKICESFHATLFQCPEKADDREEMKLQIEKSINDYISVLLQTQSKRRTALLNCAEYINAWLVQVRKMKAVYTALNMVDVSISREVLVAECWIPVKSKPAVEKALRRARLKAGSDSDIILTEVETEQVPPTYFETDKFTNVFQAIINAYGIATYREINPAPFAIVTFPFLFSVMFGDAGHGLLMTLAALAMVLAENRIMKGGKIQNEIASMFFGGRYIILLMGLFSIYSGFMYNDFFSKPINFFGSQWFPEKPYYDQYTVLKNNGELQLNPNPDRDFSGTPYAFGMDPVWMIAKNKITWLNSYKMKMSVILGVSQMTFGNFLSLLNHIYFHDWLSIVMEFIPMMLFLLSLFGYLCVLIMAKWIVFTTATSQCAPSLLITLINMFLQSTGTCATAHFFDPAQNKLQTVLLLFVFICMFWILLPKPLILLAKHRVYESTLKELELESNPATVAAFKKKHRPRKLGVHTEHEFSFGNVFIHQCIHTIEYCLGCISHTASYLRLWALSLAHAQLSEVLWMFMMHYSGSKDYVRPRSRKRCVVMFAAFAIWATLSVAILLLMEGLSAFLHTLRLHWVEFQSKFYEGDGWMFEPFSFRVMLDRFESYSD